MTDDAAHAMAKGAEGIPFNTWLGLETVVAEPGHFEVRLPWRDELGNHLGAVHAVPIVAPAEMASGCAVATAMANLLAEGFVPIAKSLRVRYRKIANGDLTAVCRVDAAVLEQAEAAARADGRADFEIPVSVDDAAGVQVAECTVEWAIRKMG
jgi:acyl-coenzyme A thioesterase PaaI-like protein